MGKLNVKLMQGIDETEKQIQQEKKQQPAYEAEKKVGEFTDRISEVQQSRALKGAAVKKNVQSDVKDGVASNIRIKKHVFSFRADIKEINIWKTYALSCGRSMESVGSEAMSEYIKKHKLSETEQAVYNALMAKNVDIVERKGEK